MSYTDFLEQKMQLGGDYGFEPEWMPEFLFPFQVGLVDWALKRGRSAIFADCGLGKTPMQLVWAENVRRKTGRPVLILTPLAVSAQTMGEAEKFGVAAAVSRDGSIAEGITITNYDRLHYFNAGDFGGVVCDESSAIKSFDGERRKSVTEFLRLMEYRLLCTATAAPNDYVELGTSSEALGELGYMDVLARFFVNDQNNSVRGMRFRWSREGSFGRVTWRFKGHAVEPFWRWVASWARALQRPSDFGYDDDGFILPPLNHRQHVVTPDAPPDGMLFDVPAIGLREERDEQRRTIQERCETAAALVEHGESAVLWCNLNAESDLLSRIVPDAQQMAGGDSPERKEELLTAFSRGELRVLVTKPKIGAWGLNWQHAAHMTFFPSHSYEQYYQAVRRMWRFGQTRPVIVDIITTKGGERSLANLERKARQADAMFRSLVAYMNDALRIERSREYEVSVEVPAWL